jgi:hypothetical protein
MSPLLVSRVDLNVLASGYIDSGSAITVESLKGTMLERIMLGSAQPVLYRGAEPTLQPLGCPWISGEGCRIGRRRAAGSLFEEYGISITDAKAGVVEADHSK